MGSFLIVLFVLVKEQSFPRLMTPSTRTDPFNFISDLTFYIKCNSVLLWCRLHILQFLVITVLKILALNSFFLNSHVSRNQLSKKVHDLCFPSLMYTFFRIMVARGHSVYSTNLLYMSKKAWPLNNFFWEKHLSCLNVMF